MDAELDTPDGDAEVQQEPEIVDAGVDSTAEVAQLRAQLEEMEKRNEFLRTGFIAAKKPHWVAEQTRLNPELTTLLGKEAIAGIDADSRRSFARKVEALAEVHSPTIGRLKALREEASLSVEQIRIAATALAREEVAAAWVSPRATPFRAPGRSRSRTRLRF